MCIFGAAVFSQRIRLDTWRIDDRSVMPMADRYQKKF